MPSLLLYVLVHFYYIAVICLVCRMLFAIRLVCRMPSLLHCAPSVCGLKLLVYEAPEWCAVGPEVKSQVLSLLALLVQKYRY